MHLRVPKRLPRVGPLVQATGLILVIYINICNIGVVDGVALALLLGLLIVGVKALIVRADANLGGLCSGSHVRGRATAVLPVKGYS